MFAPKKVAFNLTLVPPNSRFGQKSVTNINNK